MAKALDIVQYNCAASTHLGFRHRGFFNAAQTGHLLGGIACALNTGNRLIYENQASSRTIFHRDDNRFKQLLSSTYASA